MKQIVIVISELLTDQINSRFSISSILNSIPSVDQIELDFKGINFISRSAAHQLLSEVNSLQNKGVNVFLSHLDNEVERMISQVSESIKANHKHATFVERITFSNEKELDDFLFTL